MSMEERMDLAQQQIEKRQFDGAIANLRPLNDVMPRRGLLLLAKAYAGKNDLLGEISALNLCIAKNPKDYVVYVAYGHALIRAKRVEEGLTAFQEARNLNPRYRPAYDALLKELEKKGERYEARNVVNDMIKVFGPKAEFFSALCRLYAVDSYHEKTVEICEAAIEKAPNFAENHMYLGLALKEREQTDRALKVLTKATPIQYAMGELNLSKKDYVSAYNYYKSAANADPKSARAWIGYGVAAFKLQKNEEALKAFVNSCKIDRHNTRDFRSALGELRVRKDITWQSRFESGINECM
jgi:tetratricopeptide (TPR) repeat protein